MNEEMWSRTCVDLSRVDFRIEQILLERNKGEVCSLIGYKMDKRYV